MTGMKVRIRKLELVRHLGGNREKINIIRPVIRADGTLVRVIERGTTE